MKNNPAIITENPKRSSRDIRFDILKSLALLCIFLAHVNPPSLIFQLRNFDVPLLVIVSGAVFGLSTLGKRLTFLEYFKKRVFRLLIPTWTFLVFFFTLCLVTQTAYPFSLRTIINSFLLLQNGSINGVWIIRVYLLMAIATPLLFKIKGLLKNNLEYLFFLSFIYGFYELFLNIYKGSHILGVDFLVNNYLFYILPYGCLFGLGLSLCSLKRNEVAWLSLIFFALFSGLIVFFNRSFILHGMGQFSWTQEYKYPPRLYYLSYAIFVSLTLFGIFYKYQPIKGFLIKLIVFVSTSSLWIYLWQILFNYFWNWIVIPRGGWGPNFIIMYFSTIVLSLTTTFIQKKLTTIIINKDIISLPMKNLLSLMLS